MTTTEGQTKYAYMNVLECKYEGPRIGKLCGNEYDNCSTGHVPYLKQEHGELKKIIC